MCYFLGDGCTYSAGILYTAFLSAFSANSVSTSLLPGLIYALPQIIALVVCPFIKVVGYSASAAYGAALLGLSFVASSFVSEINVMYFTLGVLASIGLQLSFSSGIMAVTEAFAGSRLFPLASTCTMLGSGIGIFVANPLLAWALSLWTWSEIFFIVAAVFLNVLISATFFYWLDENKRLMSISSENSDYNESQLETIEHLKII
ncbi:unnamed protein product [Protopolystoma xenopodis]|uniref:Major facilitator superfamily (MFS) profile domain-containing protein n=1 Tax=Protopolystoma xenopodis TaxID=117903 RepID=A0A3S5AC97_9PLAT|nr:unnamed protein product [Protopolystoma xenopodis]